MRPSSTLLLLVAAGLAACSPAPPDTASTPAMRTAVAPAPPALSAGCAPAGDGKFTSKMRHVPNEDDPCADTRGVAQH